MGQARKPQKRTLAIVAAALAVVVALVASAFSIRTCATLFFYDEEEIYVSPQGENTVVVRYDYVSRPDVFQKTWYGERRIWAYPESGFMETVHFGVEWLSEGSFLLTYADVTNHENDEEYLITVPPWYVPFEV